jgi:hypothetical protein
MNAITDSSAFYPTFDGIIIRQSISGFNGGPLPLTADPTEPWHAATKNYVDNLASAAASQLSDFYNEWILARDGGEEAPPNLPLTGGILTGPLTLASNPVFRLQAATKSYVDESVKNFLPLTGGSLTGHLSLNDNPFLPAHAATKAYVDSRAASIIVSDTPPPAPIEGELWFDSVGVSLYVWYVDGTGTWVEANNSNGSAPGLAEAPNDGQVYARQGSTASWIPALALSAYEPGKTQVGPIPPPNPSTGTLWFDANGGQLYIWFTDPNSSQWVIANNTGLPEAPYDSFAYGRINEEWNRVLPLSGGTMTGPLILPGNPTNSSEAVTKGYVDSLNFGVSVGDVPPPSPAVGDLWFDSMQLQLFVWYYDGFTSQWVIANNFAGEEGGPMPPSITVGETPPPSPSPGDFWWDSSDGQGQLFIWYADPNSPQWVIANRAQGEFSMVAIVGDLPPLAAIQGTLWWNSKVGELYIFYVDPNSSQWVVANSTPPATTAIVASTPPSNPSQGELWFDTDSGKLFLFYDDGTSSQWVQINE